MPETAATRINAARSGFENSFYTAKTHSRHWRWDRGQAQWSPTTLRNTLIKVGAMVVRHGRYVTFQLSEVAVPGICFGVSRGGSMSCDEDPLQLRPGESTAR